MASVIIDNNLVDKFPLPHLLTFAITATDFYCTSIDEEYVDQVFSLAKLYVRQIQELFIYIIVSADQLVSHFSERTFLNLRSLCFTWGKGPELRVLKAIGTHLTTLEELSFGFRPSVDETGSTDDSRMGDYPLHDDIITAISPLKKLVRLTVFGDEYIADWCGSDWAWHRFFKEHVWFNQGRSYHYLEGYESNYTDGIRSHNWPGYAIHDRTSWIVRWSGNQHPPSAVVDLARRYAAALPRLRGFVCGRVQVEIARRQGGESKDHV